MRSQRCTQCGTKLDVSRMEEGSKFACSNCGAVLVAGAVEASRRSLSDSGKTFERKSRSKGAGGEGGAADKPVVSRHRRAEPERESPRRERAPAGKSKLPLFVGIGVVVVGGIVALMLSGGEGGLGGKKANPAKEWWSTVQPKVATASADELRTYLKQAQQKGFDANPSFWMAKADVLYSALAKKDSNDPVANRHLGRASLKSYSGFKDVWAGFDKYQASLPEKYARFYEKYSERVESGKDVWLSVDAFASAEALLDSFKAWRRKAEADPSPRQIKKGLSRAESFAKGFGAYPIVQEPFIVFLSSRELAKTGDAAADKARMDVKKEQFGPRAAKIKKRVQAVLKVFDERFAKPLGLKAIKGDRAFYIYAFDDPVHFAELARMGSSRGVRLDLGSSLLFFYRQYDPMAFGVIPTAPEVDKYFTSDLGHIMVHLLHKYHAKGEKSYERYFDQWNGLWLTEGFAEYVGAGASESGGFTGLSPRRAEMLRAMDSAQVPFFEIREIVRVASLQRYQRFYRDSWLPELREEEDPPQTINELIQAEGPLFGRKIFQTQAWYLSYFLNEYENGKYRGKYLDLIRTMLTGRRKPKKYGSGKWRSTEDAFAEIMGLKSVKDWDRLQEEYDGYIEKVPGE